MVNVDRGLLSGGGGEIGEGYVVDLYGQYV